MANNRSSPMLLRCMEIPERLVEAARLGDESDVASLVAVLWPHAFRFAFALTGSRALAEDAAQNACFLCVSHLHQLRHVKAFKPWFFRLLRRSVRAEQRRSFRFLMMESKRIEPHFEQPEVLMDMHDAMFSIPRELREALVVTTLFGFSSAEAAEILNVPAGTIRYRVHTARARLARILEVDLMTAKAIKESASHA